MKKKTSIALDKEILDRLKEAAKKERRSVSQMVELAIEAALPHLDRKPAKPHQA